MGRSIMTKINYPWCAITGFWMSISELWMSTEGGRLKKKDQSGGRESQWFHTLLALETQLVAQ